MILAIDQGTTGTTALLVDETGHVRQRAYREITQHYPRPGWVEHDAEEIWQSVLATSAEILDTAAPTAIGITNQRETFVLWDRRTLVPVAPAIVWQCRRGVEICDELRAAGHEDAVRSRTGLLLDPYFSGSKLARLLRQDRGLRERAEAGDLAFGTIDTWLIARLTGGREHVTEPGNASRTLLYNIHTLDWDAELLGIMEVPRALLPEVRDSSGDLGTTDAAAFHGRSIPIRGAAGDQQAALFGQACLRPGMCKNTYGTGSFVLMNTADRVQASTSGMLSTVAWRIGGRATMALEGSIFITGATLQWLRDGLQVIASAAEAGPIAAATATTGGVHLVPAFAGLGAPHWDPAARGLITGITGGTSREHIVRAAVESMAFQVNDVLQAMTADALPAVELRVDGGASVMDVLLQFQADISGLPVIRSQTAETTALGAAFLAGLASGVWANLDEVAATWSAERTFEPGMSADERGDRVAGWRAAVARALAPAGDGAPSRAPA